MPPSASGAATSAAVSNAECPAGHPGTAKTRRAPPTARSAASPQRAQRGRTSTPPSKMPSSSCAWISTPGMRGATGVAWRSPRPSAVTPINTSFRSNWRGSARPDRTSPAEMKRDGSGGAKWIHTEASGSVGIARSPIPTDCTPRAWLWITRAGSPLATRSISTPSAGTMASATVATKDMRRTIRVPPTALIRPWPTAPRSIASTLRSAAGKCRRKGRGSPPIMRTGVCWTRMAPPGSRASSPIIPTTAGRCCRVAPSSASLWEGVRVRARAGGQTPRSRRRGGRVRGDLARTLRCRFRWPPAAPRQWRQRVGPASCGARATDRTERGWSRRYRR
jgi:hypothetical protein